MMKKKLFLTLATASVVLGTCVSVYAQQPASGSVQELIATLEKQIATLKAQLETLRSAYTAVQTTSGEVKDTLKLISRLREGMSGEDVKLLQVVLSGDENIYPEGLISGFYGKLTSQAVRRFQKKHGLEQAGNVGPKTLEKLNKELGDRPVFKEADGKTHCAIVPPGHLIAPGWLRKHDGVRPIVPPCQKLPPGIETRLKEGNKGTTTPDTIPPIISGLTVGSITTVSARITWMTNEPANGKVLYATSPITGATTTLSPVSSGDFTKEHSLLLTGLSVNTTYHYYVQSSDKAGNTATSSQFMFTTLSTPDTTPPTLSGVSASNIASTSAHVVWSTNEAATSRVWYATSTPVTAVNMIAVNDAALLTSHDLTLANLTASSTYYYLVSSSDAAGNTATSSQASFLTLP